MKELEDPILFLSLKSAFKSQKIILVVSALGRYPYPFSTDGLCKSIEGKLTSQERDRLLAIGETYAVLKTGSRLRELGYKVTTLGVEEGLPVSDETYGGAHIVSMNGECLKRALEESEIVVAPGFIARTSAFHPTTLKREGSDLSAVLYAAYIKNKDLIYVKDIDYVERPGLKGFECRLQEISVKDAMALAYYTLFPICYEALALINEKELSCSVFSRDLKRLCQIDNCYPERPFISCILKDEVRLLVTNRHILAVKAEEKAQKVRFGYILSHISH